MATESQAPAGARSRISKITPAALRERLFRIYWSGATLSSVGSQLTVVAMAWQMYELTDSPLQVGMIGLARAVPQSSMLLLGGVLADAIDRRRMLLFLQIAQCLISLTLAVLTATGQATPLALYAATMALALCTALENPTRQSLVPSLVPRRALASALALNVSQGKMATIVGPSVAGLMLALWSPTWCYALDACSWFAMLTAVWLVVPRADSSMPRGTISFKALGEGFSFVWQHPVIAWLLGLDLIANLFGTPRALLPVYARDILEVGPAGLGLLYAASAAGSLAVAIGLSIVGQVRKPGLCVIIGLVVFGVGNIIFAISTVFWVAVVCLAVSGAGDTFSAVIRGTINQLSVTDDLRGRVLSLSSIFTSSGPQFGQFRSGVVAEAWGPVVSGVSGGVIVLIACVAALVPSRIRSYEVRQVGRG